MTRGLLLLMTKMAGEEVFHDAVDWKDIVEKKQKDLSKQDQVVVELQKKIGRRDERIDRLKRDLSACQRKYDG